LTTTEHKHRLILLQSREYTYQFVCGDCEMTFLFLKHPLRQFFRGLVPWDRTWAIDGMGLDYNPLNRERYNNVPAGRRIRRQSARGK
jgi:hypothetical protein